MATKVISCSLLPTSKFEGLSQGSKKEIDRDASKACIGSCCIVDFYGLFTRSTQNSTPFLYRQNHTPSMYFIERSIMDVVFIVGSIGLWVSMVFMVWGLKKLEKPEGKQS